MAKRGFIYKPEFKLSTVEFDINNKEHVKFELVHNIDHIEGSIGSLFAAVDNWTARTNTYTRESLIDYINSKGVHEAMTKEQADKRNINYGNK